MSEPEPPADISGIELQIVENPGLGGPIFAVAIVAGMILIMVLCS